MSIVKLETLELPDGTLVHTKTPMPPEKLVVNEKRSDEGESQFEIRGEDSGRFYGYEYSLEDAKKLAGYLLESMKTE